MRDTQINFVHIAAATLVTVAVVVALTACGLNYQPSNSRTASSSPPVFAGNCLTEQVVSNDLHGSFHLASQKRSPLGLNCAYVSSGSVSLQVGYSYDQSPASDFRSGLAEIAPSKLKVIDGVGVPAYAWRGLNGLAACAALKDRVTVSISSQAPAGETALVLKSALEKMGATGSQ